MKKKAKTKKRKTTPRAGAGKKIRARAKTKNKNKNKKRTPAKTGKSRPKRSGRKKPLRSSKKKTSAARKKKPLRSSLKKTSAAGRKKPLRSSNKKTSAAGKKKPLVKATSLHRPRSAEVLRKGESASQRREHARLGEGSAGARAAAGPVPEKLERKVRRRLRGILEAKRREIVEAYRHAKQSSFEEDETYGTHDIGDMAASSYAREFFLTLSGSERELLLQIETALQRMDERKYGVCEICRKRIDPARLVAIPWATQCVPCQAEAEGG